MIDHINLHNTVYDLFFMDYKICFLLNLHEVTHCDNVQTESIFPRQLKKHSVQE